MGMFDKYVSLLRSVYDVGGAASDAEGPPGGREAWEPKPGAELERLRSHSFSFSPPPKIKLGDEPGPEGGARPPIKSSGSHKDLRKMQKKRDRVRSLVQAGQKKPVPVEIDGSVRQVHRATINSVHDLLALQRLQLHGAESKNLRDFPQVFHKLFSVLKRCDGVGSNQRRKWSLTGPPSLPSSPRSPRVGARVAPAGPRTLSLLAACAWPWLPTEKLMLPAPAGDAPPTPSSEELFSLKLHVNRGNWRQVESMDPVCALHLLSDLVFSIHQPIVSSGDMRKLIQAPSLRKAALTRCTCTILERVAHLLTVLSVADPEEDFSPPNGSLPPDGSEGAPGRLEGPARFASFWFAWLFLRPAECDEGALLDVTALAKLLRHAGPPAQP